VPAPEEQQLTSGTEARTDTIDTPKEASDAAKAVEPAAGVGFHKP